jgi:hypothetical protein
MNLIQVQDRLNKLPALPQSIQYLTAAAQGGNPQVPPFMALARISEINKEIQSAQQAQPPAEPLNESLPKQALQSMGINALQQGQQQQGMQQVAQQAGAAQRAVPPGIPQPVRQQQPPPQQMQMAQQAPRPMPQGAPQMQQRPQGMAGGGLAGLHVDPRMFEYGSGGVVAFNGEDGDQEVESNEGYDATASMAKLAPIIKTALSQRPPSISAPSDIEKKLREGKDYGIDEGPVGKSYLEGLESLKNARAAERAKQQSDIDERKKFATSRSLLDYSDASRGQTGLGGIGALARSRMGSAEKFMGEEAGLREDAIKQDALMNEARYKFQELRTAKLKGDVAGEYKAQSDLAKIAKDLKVSQNQLMGRLATGNLNLLGRQATAQAAVDASQNRKEGTLGAADTAAGASKYKADVAAGASKYRTDAPPKTGGMAEAASERTEQYKKRLQNTQDQAIIKDDTGTFTKEQKAQAAQRILNSRSGQAPAAPATLSPAEQAFNAKWATLTSGQKLIGPDGKEYTKK